MATVEDAVRQQDEAAERRVAERSGQRRRNVAAMRSGEGFASLNSPELVARRLDRLIAYRAGERLPGTPDELAQAPSEDLAGAALERALIARLPGVADAASKAPIDAAGGVLEALIGDSELLDVRWLEAGVVAARAVGRVHIRHPDGRTGHATGSLVTPRLLLTNHHVLPDAESARGSRIEFDYQLGLDGKQLSPQRFRFDPDAFFLADAALDFALVAIDAAEDVLAAFGVNRIVEAQGKAGISDYVTIVQHPAGRLKEIALRENRIVDESETMLHYAADTERGSSGSPVFNDQWEVVALHHKSVPVSGEGHDDELGSVINEGVRISRIAAAVRAHDFPPAQRALVERLGAWERIEVATHTLSNGSGTSSNGSGPTATPTGPAVARMRDGRIELAIPLELTVGLAGPAVLAAGKGYGDSIAAPAPQPEPLDGSAALEAVTIDRDYAARRGYDPAFLGTGARRVSLPTLTPALRAQAAVNSLAQRGAAKHVLPYHHFSVVLNKERRLAFFAAVNIDGLRSKPLKRETDRWSLDPRVPADQQTGEAGYVDPNLDRGHLVRRLDPVWGDTLAEAKLANDDTFHFTNCTPQHKDFNRLKAWWAGVENYILENAATHDLRVSVFTGPVFADDDEEHDGVRLPRQFWKVVAMAKQDGRLSATAYLLSQQELLREDGFEAAPAPEAFTYGAYKLFQTTIDHVEGLTGIRFGKLAQFDPLAGEEATTAAAAARPLRSLGDIVL